jgi:hypothetical protein
LPDSTYAESLQPFTLFAKNLHIGYIAKNFENVLAFQNFFQKIFLWHPPADRTSAFQQYSMRQFAKFAKTTLYRGYFQNLPQLRCCFPKKSEKNITSTPLTIKIPPLFCYTLFNFFSKIFVSPLLTITFLPRKGHTCSKNFSKKTPHC